ncbi:hypothetical protein O3P69_001340 [Scylla paramamosain]|uniref:PDEase domain-containing protein n=1 Tax=Scylla paramamosain TaxID=85552 RepID=A0AAW0UQZ0_SCYPA
MGDFQALTGLPGPAVEPETLLFWRHSQLSPVPLTAGRLCHCMLPKDLQWNQEHSPFLAAFAVVTSATRCWKIVSLYATEGDILSVSHSLSDRKKRSTSNIMGDLQAFTGLPGPAVEPGTLSGSIHSCHQCQSLLEYCVTCLALLVACLCHDLDHRGTNNSFQIKASSPLAQLYTTSSMGHHHFDQSVMILNSCGNQILSNCTPDEYSQVISVLEDAILATGTSGSEVDSFPW